MQVKLFDKDVMGVRVEKGYCRLTIAPQTETNVGTIHLFLHHHHLPRKKLSL